jgi:hypothetical protein
VVRGIEGAFGMSKIFSSKSTNSGAQTTAIDPVQRQMMLDAYGRMKTVADSPYQPYGGQTVAGMTGDQHQAANLVRSGVSQNIGGGALQNAMGMTTQAGGWTPGQISAQSVNPSMVSAGRFAGTDMSQYMNPYLGEVAGGMVSDMERARQGALGSNADAAIAAGAYGGSRHGVVDVGTNREFFDTLGKNLTSLYSGGFDRASQLAVGDIDRSMQGQMANQGAGLQAGMANQGADLSAQNANNQWGATRANLGLSAGAQLAGMGQQERENYFQNAGLLQGIGDRYQAQDQAYLDDSYARFQEEQNHPMQMAGMLGNFVNGMPSMGSTTTGGSTARQSPSIMNSLGQGLGMAGALMAFSDKNIKSGRKKFGVTGALKAIEKTPVETWKYDPAKGGPADGETHIGPMAQAVKKNLGLGSGKSFPVVDMIGTQMAATQALAKKVRKLEGKKGAKK